MTFDTARLTDQGLKVMEISLREALSLGESHVGSQHILLGIARHRECRAAGVLETLGLTADQVRDEVIRQCHPKRSNRSYRTHPAVLDDEMIERIAVRVAGLLREKVPA